MRSGLGAQLDNVLLDGSQPLPIIKMCDFGYSKDEVAGSLCKTACGTPEYMAPEVGCLLPRTPLQLMSIDTTACSAWLDMLRHSGTIHGAIEALHQRCTPA